MFSPHINWDESVLDFTELDFYIYIYIYIYINLQFFEIRNKTKHTQTNKELVDDIECMFIMTESVDFYYYYYNPKTG